MFKKIRDELAALNVTALRLHQVIRTLSERPHDGEAIAALGTRVAELEGAIEAVAGRAEAGLVEMGAIKAASAAHEQRARGHLKRGEAAYELARGIEGGEEVDSFEAVGRAFERGVYDRDDAEEPGVSALPSGVENSSTDREIAKSAKRR